MVRSSLYPILLNGSIVHRKRGPKFCDEQSITILAVGFSRRKTCKLSVTCFW